jgi:hypothetical protein
VSQKIRVQKGVDEPKDIGDYDKPEKDDIEKELPGLKCEVIEGE